MFCDTGEETHKILESISIKTKPTVKTFVEGTAFTVNGVITLHYDNNTTEDKDITIGMCSGYNMNSVGSQTVTITEGGKTATYGITVNAKSVDSIAMKTNPDKTSYIEGQELDLAGAKITASYNNGTYSDFPINASMISGYNENTIGTQNVTVTYEGKTTTFSVSVRAKAITGIVISKQPDKKAYIEGQHFDKTGMVVTANYDNGTSETVTNYTINKTVLTVADTSVMVSYLGKEATLTGLTVREKQLFGIAVTKNPTKMTYIEGQALDMANGEITLTYDNGDTKTKVLTNGMVTGFDKNKLGEQVLTITEGGKTTAIKVMVNAKKATSISVKTNPKTTYIEGQPLVLSGGIINAIYDNGTNSDIEMTDSALSMSEFDKNLVGTQSITVTYQGRTATFNVVVKAKTVLSIAVKTNPSKIEYLEGQDFVATGGVINVIYDNGTSEDIAMTNEMVSGYDKVSVSEQVLTVTYQTKTATIKTTVLSKSNVNKLIKEIDNLKIDDLTVNDKERVAALKATYDAMKAVEQEAITNKSKLNQAIAKTNNSLYPEFFGKYDNNKIEVSAPVGVLPSDAIFNIERKEPTKDLTAKIKSEFGMFSECVTVLDITLKDANGNLIQPNKENGKVKVSVKLDGKYKDSKNLAVVYIDEKGNIVELVTQIKDGCAVFETDHFSQYVLLEKNNQVEKPIEKPVNHLAAIPATGDFTAIGLYVVLLIASSAAIVVLYRKKKSIV